MGSGENEAKPHVWEGVVKVIKNTHIMSTSSLTRGSSCWRRHFRILCLKIENGYF